MKRTLTQNREATIRFINGLFNGCIPLDATIDWLDKESVDAKSTAVISDFYPRINGRMYVIEVEQDSKNSDMVVRVCKYSVGGAMLHG